MYKIGRRSRSPTARPSGRSLSLIGPAAGEIGRRRARRPRRTRRRRAHFVEGGIGGAPSLACAPTSASTRARRPRTPDGVIRGAGRAGAAVARAPPRSLRIESGRPRYGVDMTEDNLPAEAGIVDRAVSFTKGCYVGQEPVARMHYKGRPNRHLRGLGWRSHAEPASRSSSPGRRSGGHLRPPSPRPLGRSRSRWCGARSRPGKRSWSAQAASRRRSSSFLSKRISA